jgi:2-dehydro-3-deoxyphosphogluconate aldolase/(4S)-4-hydroxy-2-oxoglutarate aldolase
MAEPERMPLPKAIVGPGVVAIARRRPGGALADVAAALHDGGIRALEITLDSDDALVAIGRLTGGAGPDGLLVGAGTVLDPASAERAVDAGAAFLVSPHLDPELVAWAASRGVPVLPGAFSPTEVLAAWRAGASAVKVFPVSAVGPSYVRELGGPFAGLPLIPTGGLTTATLGDFIAAGAVAVGLGGGLLGDGDPDGVAKRAREALAAVARARAARTARAEATSVPSTATTTEVRR